MSDGDLMNSQLEKWSRSLVQVVLEQQQQHPLTLREEREETFPGKVFDIRAALT